MMSRTCGVGALFSVLALTVAACGSGTGSDEGVAPVPSGGQADVSIVEDVDHVIVDDVDQGTADLPTPVVVATAIIEVLGPEEGVAATLYALDAGYSAAQLVDAALAGSLGADGTIAGAEPVHSDHGLIAPPISGIRRSGPTPERTPDDVQAEINRKLSTIETINLLGAPLGLGGEFGYDDVFPADPEQEPTAREAAIVTIGVTISLIDMGYSFDQVVNGFVFGEIEMAIGVNRSGERAEGQSIDGTPIAACFVLRDSTGNAIEPAGRGTNRLLASATCGKAIRTGTFSFDGVGGLDDSEEQDETTTSTTATPSPASDAITPSLTVRDTEVAFVGCPDPNFPDVCNYDMAVTLDYVTPAVPATLRCSMGLFQDAERQVTDHSGTATLTVTFSVLWGSAFQPEDLDEPGASCTMIPPGLTVEAVGDAAEPPE